MNVTRLFFAVAVFMCVSHFAFGQQEPPTTGPDHNGNMCHGTIQETEDFINNQAGGMGDQFTFVAVNKPELAGKLKAGAKAISEGRFNGQADGVIIGLDTDGSEAIVLYSDDDDSCYIGSIGPMPTEMLEPLSRGEDPNNPGKSS